MTTRFLFGISASLLLFSCGASHSDENKDVQAQAQVYLDQYNTDYQKLYTISSEADWKLSTHIVPGDTLSQHEADMAGKALAKFTGSKSNIDSAKKYLAIKDKLTPLQAKQFETILFNAGSNPETAGEIVAKRISATNKQTNLLYGYKFTIDKKPVTTGDIDDVLRTSKDLNQRLKAWTASKEVGKVLKPGLIELQNLRNASVKPLDYKDFFDYQAHEYGMSGEEMVALTRQFVKEVWPLYRELHTWTRYELANRYKQPVPDEIPAHWLPNRWGQDWSELVEVKGLSIDSVLKAKGTEWMVHKGEDFYKSIGFNALPKSFYEKSSLYPVPADSPFSKNNHASAWHLDLKEDVRSLMSITPTTDYWGTILHEFGHIYYYMAYSNPNVPLILRGGANRGYHEAFGTMMGLASLQKPFLENVELIKPGLKTDDTLKLLNEALSYIVVIPWGAGVMTEFEHALYAENLSPDQYNQKWWELVKKYQGIVPPSERGEAFCDAATKTHINDDPAQYYDYAIANILLFQFHTYIAKNILKQDPHATNYWGNKQVGEFLKKVMEPGASVDWRAHLKDCIGSDMSAKDMVDYFQPLMVYLKKANQGRKHALPETL
jgi:peptidyl-dipeptidase A